jgi:outer membrane protein TolC
MKHTFVIIILGLLLLPLSAEQLITLSGSIELAKQQNKALMHAREEVGVYRQEYNNIRGNLFPQISLSGGYQYSHSRLPKAALPQLPSLVDMLDNAATANDSLIAGYIDDGFGAFVPSRESGDHTLAGTISLSQVIFMGGKLINGINIAGKLYTLQEKRFWLEEQNLIFQTIDLYYKTKLAGEMAEIQEEALAFANMYFAQVSIMYEEGLVSEYDLLRSELEVKKLEPQVMEAQKNFKLAKENFANHLNLESSDIILIDDIDLPEFIETDLSEALQTALQQRMELELSQIGVDVNKVTLRYEKGNFLPNIGISADYTFYGADEDKIERDDWGSSYQIGIGFSMPLFTGLSNSSKIKKARHKLKQAELNHRTLQEMIELDVKNAYLQLEADLQKLEVQTKNVELATKGMQIANARYENYLSNQLEVIDAQLQLKTAKLSLLNARYNAALSNERLKKAIGFEL